MSRPFTESVLKDAALTRLEHPGYQVLYSPTTVVVAITSTLPPRPFPFVVVVEPVESGLPHSSAIHCASCHHPEG